MKQLELYIHIPFCMKKCNYCDFLSFAEREETQNAYIAALVKEIEFYGAYYKEYWVPTVYIGGGTPSWPKAALIAAVVKAIKKSFQLLPEAEITIECNPGTVTMEKLALYREMGINRLSIGLQSADDSELQLLGRVHTFAQFIKTFELARANGFDNINVDLMSGLPGQKTKDFRATLQKVLMLRPEHISAYSLIVEEGTPFYEAYKFDVIKQQAGLPTEQLPTEEETYGMIKAAEQMLAQAGYEHYEISNFAKPGFACKHNVGYWKREDYLGLGLGAASLLGEYRYSNIRDLQEYIRQAHQLCFGLWQQENGEEYPATNLHGSVEKLSAKACMEEFMFLGLRMTKGVARADFECQFARPIEAVYQNVFQKLTAQGLLMKKEGRIFLTERGQEVSNYVLAQFLFD